GPKSRIAAAATSCLTGQVMESAIHLAHTKRMRSCVSRALFGLLVDFPNFDGGGLQRCLGFVEGSDGRIACDDELGRASLLARAHDFVERLRNAIGAQAIGIEQDATSRQSDLFDSRVDRDRSVDLRRAL